MATAEAMAQRGFAPLEVPANYYDDVEARFGLAPDKIERLRRHGILYDRDEAGEYLQMYSRLYGEGFFFEIIQRDPSYGGYGAANAPVRIAAQKRGMKPLAKPAIAVM